MLKILLRTLVILLVTLLVAGGLYLLVENGNASSAAFGPEPQFDNRTTTGERQSPPDGFSGRGEHGGEGEFSLGRGLGGMFGTLLKMGVITLLVLLAQKLLTKTPRPVQTGSA